MQNPILTWYVEENNKISPYDEYYAGTVTPGQKLNIKILLWNNRWGDEDVQDLVNPLLYIYFDNIEDDVLLNMCSISIDNDSYDNLNIDSGQSVITINRSISGRSNNGTLENNENYCVINLEIGPIKNGLRNVLKNLYLSIDSMSL